MPYPPHGRLVWGGSLWTGAEIWSCSLKIGIDPEDGDPGDIPALTQTLGEIIRDAWHTEPNSRTHSTAVMEWVKFNEIDSTGHYASDFQSNLWELPTPAAGGSTGANYHPSQVTRVITLKSGRRRGPASRGRFYSPMPLTTLGADGRDAVSVAQNCATAAATMIESLNSALTNMRVSLISPVGSGEELPVTSVSVGRVLDTQRRRRSALDEDPQSDDVEGSPIFGPGG